MSIVWTNSGQFRLTRYASESGLEAAIVKLQKELFGTERVYVDHSEPIRDISRLRRAVDLSEVDTVVVPAWEDGFQETFIQEKRWHAARTHGTMRPRVKYIAAYRVAPISAITHIAPVHNIEVWKDSDKFVLNFSEPAREIGPIALVKGGSVRAPQSLRYTTKDTLVKAKTLDDVW